MHAVLVPPRPRSLPRWQRGARLAFAGLGLLALIANPLQLSGAPGYTLGNQISSFTVQSNLLAVAVLAIGGLRDPAGRRWQLWRGAATLYLLVAATVCAALLSLDADRPWSADVLHRVLPIVLLADWVAAPCPLGVGAHLLRTWLAYPVAYTAYTLVRGPIVDWYPYPFLDPRGQGYVSMTIGLVVLGVAFALLAVAVVALGELAGRWCGTAESDKKRWLE
ncbi:Pr6Pr family membrane protein [Nocardia sp. NPDC127579]|uniref:Pr6Pr family membrane protein n=1 Tax=Nocardia sp. NPDC127579 TaxID=3345402 RepID=UPI003640752E